MDMRLSSREPAIVIVQLALPLGSTHLAELAWVDEELYNAVAVIGQPKYVILVLPRDVMGAGFLSALVRFVKRLRRQDCRLVVVATGIAAEVLRVTRLDQLFVTHSSLDAAVHWCRTGKYLVSHGEPEEEMPDAHVIYVKPAPHRYGIRPVYLREVEGATFPPHTKSTSASRRPIA